MIVYHIDRDNCLKEGQMINLIQSHNSLLLKKKMFPEGISKHGIHYLSDEFQNIGGNRPEYILTALAYGTISYHLIL